MFGLGFPHSSVGKESACNAGDPGSIPGCWIYYFKCNVCFWILYFFPQSCQPLLHVFWGSVFSTCVFNCYNLLVANFYIIKHSSSFVVIFFSFKVYFSDIRIAITAFYDFCLHDTCFFHPFSFSLFVSLNFKCVSCILRLGLFV